MCYNPYFITKQFLKIQIEVYKRLYKIVRKSGLFSIYREVKEIKVSFNINIIVGNFKLIFNLIVNGNIKCRFMAIQNIYFILLEL